MKLLSHVRLLATPWTAAYQAPPSMGFSSPEYWRGVRLPSHFQHMHVLIDIRMDSQTLHIQWLIFNYNHDLF